MKWYEHLLISFEFLGGEIIAIIEELRRGEWNAPGIYWLREEGPHWSEVQALLRQAGIDSFGVNHAGLRDWRVLIRRRDFDLALLVLALANVPITNTEITRPTGHKSHAWIRRVKGPCARLGSDAWRWLREHEVRARRRSRNPLDRLLDRIY